MSADWGPVIVAVALFILLSPGLLFQLPARTRVMEFGNMSTVEDGFDHPTGPEE
ncbi:BnaC06g13380D [Brassica napus]|uniref:BnaC06g13380D protein n=1 Tax=Brassica napus TaxID=3708 RepID=A0A078FBF7_BRANA|nr:BnaC06g13380D [Brassica napus]